jgi:sulfonate transport system permease protein
LVPVLFFVWWQLAASTGWIDKRLYPLPTKIASSFWDLITDGRLRHDIIITLKRTAVGSAVGMTAGFAMGVVMGASRWVRVAFESSFSALYVIPKIALFPVFLTIFGLGEMPKYMLVAVTVFFFVWIGAMEAIAGVPTGYREAAQAFDVNRWQMFRHVLLPSALPQLFVGLRIGIGVGIGMTIAAEFVAGTDGLGQLIFSSRLLFLNDWMYVGIVVVAVLGVILQAIVSWIGRRVTPWLGESGTRVPA